MYARGSSLAFVVVMLVMLVVRYQLMAGRRRRRWGAGPRGPWGSPGGGTWRGGGPWGGRQARPPATGWPGSSPQGGAGRPWSPGRSSPQAGPVAQPSPVLLPDDDRGAPGPAAGGNWSAGGGSTGGGPAGGGWASPAPRDDAAVPAGPGRGAGARLANAPAPWPGAPVPGGGASVGGAPDWRDDPRPASESIPAELFPVEHARQVQAAHPLDQGLAAIRAHDPGFDLEQFVQRAQQVFFQVQQAWSERDPGASRRVMADGLWQAQRSQVEAYRDAHRRNVVENLTVSNIWPVGASCSGGFDVVTVRVVAACADYDVDDRSGQVLRDSSEVAQFAEDWTFQRSSSTTTKAGGTTMGSRCPNCGAPLDVDVDGTCHFCHVPIMSGQYDWVLARISQVG